MTYNLQSSPHEPDVSLASFPLERYRSEHADRCGMHEHIPRGLHDTHYPLVLPMITTLHSSVSLPVRLPAKDGVYPQKEEVRNQEVPRSGHPCGYRHAAVHAMKLTIECNPATQSSLRPYQISKSQLLPLRNGAYPYPRHPHMEHPVVNAFRTKRWSLKIRCRMRKR